MSINIAAIDSTTCHHNTDTCMKKNCPHMIMKNPHIYSAIKQTVAMLVCCQYDCLLFSRFEIAKPYF